ncbi:hypothetical protein [Marinobacter orientalis]|uniref:Uncharacterized protein n=1 Tax=Marinobacter orientalis TaxID=1928859 RepID=A0A7Y0RAU1_9GAMM|nr:hypothetical protein [Marinobacter orientalis]NMT62567.1 hypothetical protein [Marinobacter orientalis]TGX51260.1 hypothetical protein DIT72_04310 [Marinobacter orientalis]
MLDSAWLRGVLRKAVAAIIGFMLAFVLLVALLITSFYMLVNAATLALSPWLGDAGAMAATGLFCLLLLALFFYRMTRPVASKKSASEGEDGKGQSPPSPIDSIRNLVRNNPLEAVAAAFTLGVVEQSDPRLKSLLMQGGMVLMKEAEAEQAHAKEKADPPASETDAPAT